jgi:hypothetical protein
MTTMKETESTDPEVYYFNSGTLNGLHGTLNETLNGLDGMIQMENGLNALTSISKFAFRKLSLFINYFHHYHLLIYLQTLRNFFVE